LWPLCGPDPFVALGHEISQGGQRPVDKDATVCYPPPVHDNGIERRTVNQDNVLHPVCSKQISGPVGKQVRIAGKSACRGLLEFCSEFLGKADDHENLRMVAVQGIKYAPLNSRDRARKSLTA